MIIETLTNVHITVCTYAYLIISTDWLILLCDWGRGFLEKYNSISSALAFVQNRLVLTKGKKKKIISWLCNNDNATHVMNFMSLCVLFIISLFLSPLSTSHASQYQQVLSFNMIISLQTRTVSTVRSVPLPVDDDSIHEGRRGFGQ